MATRTPDPPLTGHPVLRCVADIGAALDEVTDVDPLYMRTADKAAALLGIEQQRARLDELALRVLAGADDVAAESGDRHAGEWLSRNARLDGAEGRRRLRLARALDGTYGTIRAGLRDGEVHLDQARVLVRALEELPEDLQPGLRADAEAHLVERAAEFRPRALQRLGRRILEVVAPGVAEEHLRRLLERDDARAAAVTSLTTRRRGDGTTDLLIRVADATAERLLTYLHAYTSPRRQPSDSDRRPYEQRLGQAFGAFLEAVGPQRLPLHGGDATTLMVTIPIATLTEGLGSAALVDGTPISAGQARRLACTAQLLPVVLDGTSEVLDVGRAQRLFTRAQRKAMAVRDRTCRAEGCEVPASWCEAHHRQPWSSHGPTDLANGVLLCPHHHHRAHDARYDTRHDAAGRVSFHRRT